jgi:hypothetical protein
VVDTNSGRTLQENQQKVNKMVKGWVFLYFEMVSSKAFLCSKSLETVQTTPVHSQANVSKVYLLRLLVNEPAGLKVLLDGEQQLEKRILQPSDRQSKTSFDIVMTLLKELREKLTDDFDVFQLLF